MTKCSRSTKNSDPDCNGFIIHTPDGGAIPVTEGMEIHLDKISKWEVETSCRSRKLHVQTKLIDTTTNEIVKSGEDINGLNGEFEQ